MLYFRYSWVYFLNRLMHVMDGKRGMNARLNSLPATSRKMSARLKDAHLSDIRLTGNSVNSSESGAGLNGMRSSENRTLKTKFIK